MSVVNRLLHAVIIATSTDIVTSVKMQGEFGASSPTAIKYKCGMVLWSTVMYIVIYYIPCPEKRCHFILDYNSRVS